MFMMISLGAVFLVNRLKNGKVRNIGIIAGFTLGMISFICFQVYYYSDYQALVVGNFKTGLKQSVEYAESIRDDGVIYLQDYPSYPSVLFYSKAPADDPELNSSRSEGIKTVSFTHYSTDIDASHSGDICILLTDSSPDWIDENNILYSSGEYMVVRR